MSEQLLDEPEVLRPLTPRQQRFVEEYLHDLNGTKAAIRVGYSPHSANVQAAKLVADPSVAAAIQRAKEVRAARVGMSADAVIQEFAILANARIDHYMMDANGNLVPTPDAPSGAMAAIKSLKKKTRVSPNGDVTYEVEFALWDKLGTMKIMGKHVGVAACADRVEVTGKDGGPILTALSDLSPDALKAHLDGLKKATETLE